MSRIRQVLTLHTNLGSAVNFSLQATIPTHMLTQCAAALPRPTWEPLLYYVVLLAMGFLLLCVLLAAYFEAERLFTADVIKRRSELNQMAFDRSKVFDLKAIANFKLPSDSSKISPNLYMSRRLAAAAAASASATTTTTTNVGSHPEAGKVPSGTLHQHRRESWWSRMLRKLTFWQSSSVATGTAVGMRHSSPDVSKYGAVAEGTKTVGTASAVPVSNERTAKKVGLLKSLLKYIFESHVVRSFLRRIWKSISPKQFAPKSTKSAARPPGDQGKDLNVTDADANVDQNNPTPSAQKKNSEQEHQKRQLEAKPVVTNKEKNIPAPHSANSSAASSNTQAPVGDELPLNKKESQL